jgi:hypothetical protein
VIVPAAAHAAVDPRCAETFGQISIPVQGPEEAPTGLPPQLTAEGMACFYTFSGTTGYVYLDDPFGRLTTMLASFLADGWTVEQIVGDDTRVPFDIATLPSHATDPEFTLALSRGPDHGGLVYVTDSVDFFGVGLFAYFEPLLAAPVAGTGVDIDDPSSLSDLRTIGRAVPNPLQSVALLGTASGLTVLLGVPGFLLSTVFTSRYEQWFGWLKRGRLGALGERVAAASTGRRRWLFLAGGLVLAALISGFVDPRFGLNPMSLRLFLTMLLSFVVFNVGAWAAISVVLRRTQSDARPALSLHPLAVVVLALAVLVSRLLGFSPGVVFGLVAGVAFAITLALSRKALVILVGSAYAVIVALIAWLAYSLINASGPPDAAALVALSEFFSGVTIQGVSTLPIALVPLATLDGGTLFAWKKWAWAISYAVGLAVFMLVLFSLPGGEAAIDGDFTRWVLIFGVFVVLALGVWLVDWLLRRRAPVARPLGGR